MKARGIVAAAVLMIATGAFAEEPEGDQAATQEKRICKTKKVTGSLTRVRRTCLTQSQWRRLTEVNAINRDRMEDDANMATCIRASSACYPDAVAHQQPGPTAPTGF